MKAWGATLDPDGKSGVSDNSHRGHRLASPPSHSRASTPSSPPFPFPCLAPCAGEDVLMYIQYPQFRSGDDHIRLGLAPFSRDPPTLIPSPPNKALTFQTLTLTLAT